MTVYDCLEDVKKKVGGVHLMNPTNFDASLYLHIIFMQFCDIRLASCPSAPGKSGRSAEDTQNRDAD